MKKIICSTFLSVCFLFSFSQSNIEEDTTLIKLKVNKTPVKGVQSQDKNELKNKKESFVNAQNAAWIAPLVTSIGFIVTISLFIVQNRIKRKDDKLDKQLKRLDKQLSDLYGPLYAWYQIGVSNYKSYIKSGNYSSFADPHYRVWLTEVFMRTNEEIEKTIINNAELFIDKLPKECIQFCQHIASLRVCLSDEIMQVVEPIEQDRQKQLEIYKALKSLDNRMKSNPHPSYKLQAYVEVAFSVIQRERNKLLLKSPKLISEEKIYSTITTETLRRADNLKIADEFYNRFLYLPFDIEKSFNTIHNNVIKEKKVHFERIYWYTGEADITPSNTKETYSFLEEIEYNNGNNIGTALYNNKSELISRVENVFQKNGCIKEQYYYLRDKDKDNLTSKAVYTFSQDLKIKKIAYYEPVEALEFTFEYEEVDNKAIFKKLDSNRTLLKHIEQETLNSSSFLFKWFKKGKENDNTIDAECKIVKNKSNDVEERINIDPKLGQESQILYKYDYNKMGLKRRLRKMSPNGECEVTKIYDYELYT